MSLKSISSCLLSSIFILCVLNTTAQTQLNKKNVFAKFSIDTFLLQELKQAQTNSESFFSLPDFGFWNVIMGEEAKSFKNNKDIILFLDTSQTYFEVECDCMIKKDTIYIQGGFAYGAGAGFDVRITKDLFSGSIWLAGDKYETSTSSNLDEEIFLKTIHQTLNLQNKKSLKRNGIIAGKIIMESENFFDKEKKVSDKLFMKLLFTCELDDVIVL